MKITQRRNIEIKSSTMLNDCGKSNPENLNGHLKIFYKIVARFLIIYLLKFHRDENYSNIEIKLATNF